MSKFWTNFRADRELNSAIKNTIISQDPTPLARLLSEKPTLVIKVIETAIQKITNEPWNSLWMCLALIRQDNNAAIDLLHQILQSEFAGWKRIRHEHQKMILDYLRAHHQTGLFLKYSEQFDTFDFPVPIEQMTHDKFYHWLKEKLSDTKTVANLRQTLITFLENVTFDKVSGPEMETGFENVYYAGLQLWNHSLKEESLEILRLLAAMAPNLIGPKTLKTIAASLPDLIPQESSELFISGDEQMTLLLSEHMNKDQFIPAVPSSVARGADILRAFPSNQWVEDLKTAWIYVSKYIRRTCRKNDSKQIPPGLAMAGNALAIALGACTAKSLEPVDIGSKNEQVNALIKQLEDDINQRNALASSFKDLKDQYETLPTLKGKKQSTLENKIKDLKIQIREFEERIEELQNEIEQSLSPTHHLLNTLRNGQDYPDIIQQAAAWGLYHILDQGVLTPSSTRKIQEALRMAILEDDWDDDKLKVAVEDILSRDVELTDAEFDMVSKYLSNPNQVNLANILSRLSDRDELHDEITSLLDRILSSINGSFAERAVYIFPSTTALEIEINLRDGLNWMVDLVEKHRDPELSHRLNQHLGWTVALMREYLPQMEVFLERYPLRLMDLSHHKKILGQYNHEKCDLIYWTRYEPPIWKPGMSPEDAGRVLQRYLSTDDRSTPNSMGIYYRLFEHPVLSLPVIYHEFLHFGGPSGIPSQAIANESEVWMREILFMQHLIASLSPVEESAIPAYENEIVEVIESLSLHGLGVQIQCDFSNSQTLSSFCDMIERIYGTPLTEDDASLRIEEVVRRKNRSIQLMNRTEESKLCWHPEIEWPLMDSDQTQTLTEQYKAILKRGMTTQHRLDENRYKKLMDEQVCQCHLTKWEEYRNGDVATRAFGQCWTRTDAAAAEMVVSIVDRFNVKRE